jgi:hypothetical protein
MFAGEWVEETPIIAAIDAALSHAEMHATSKIAAIDAALSHAEMHATSKDYDTEWPKE